MAVSVAEQPIGLYDSGLGGLSVWQAVRAALPAEHLIYVADTAHVPYGEKSRHAIVARALAMADYFHHRGVKAIVVPCNTATAAAIAVLRERHPHTPVVGIEPAIKPAALLTRTGCVGVLATTGTLSSPRFRQLLSREAGAASVLLQPCPEWVAAVENGHVDDDHALRVVGERLAPVLDAGADVLVLGCTHFPFLMQPIRHHVGDTMPVLETGEAVARQLMRQLSARGLLHPDEGVGKAEFLSSGDPEHLSRVGGRLLAPGPRHDALAPAPALAPTGPACHGLAAEALPLRWR